MPRKHYGYIVAALISFRKGKKSAVWPMQFNTKDPEKAKALYKRATGETDVRVWRAGKYGVWT